ncbi:MAG TPA: hypothetical protein VH042_04895 [Solirubrobacterales bacterium]|jgi:hypothetical protein|nr:hypothetical protein [Solirubrobacterales bacterium]
MRRLLPSGIAGIVAVALLAVVATGTAIAYFTTTGAGNSNPAVVSAIAQPTITAATPATGGTVALTWGAVTAPGSGTVTYKVSRNGESASGTCSPTLAVVTCTDIGLEPGTYNYVVTAKWRTWSTESAVKTAKVTVGPADHLTLTATSSTPTAGAADNLTITAKDAKGGTVTTYTGSHNLTFSGAPASPNGTLATVVDSSGAVVNFGSATALTFTAGVASVASSKNGVMKLYARGEADVEANEGTISTSTPLELTVASATASKFVPTAADTSPTAGEADNLTITAIDAYGNTATSYTGSKSLTFSGATTIGTNKPTVANSSGTATAFGTATTITFSSGVATVSSSKNGVMTLYKAESSSISVTEGTITTATPLEVTVSSAAAAKFVLTATSTTPAAGEADSLTTTAQDIYGNIATSYTGSKSLTFSGASESTSGTAPTVSSSAGTNVAFGSTTVITFAAGVATVNGSKNGVMKLYKSSSTNLKATDGTLLTPTALTVTVSGATAVKLVLAAASTTPAAGASDNLTITAQDEYENAATPYTGSKNLTFSGAATIGVNKPTVVSSGGTATAFGTATAITFSAGIATVSSSKNGLMKIYAAGEADLEVSDGTISTETPLEVNVSPLAFSKFTFTAANTTPTVGEVDDLTTTALDTYGNVATGYTGSHSLVYSGASASPSGETPTVTNSFGTEIAFGTATPTNFTAGVATVSGTKNGAMKLYKTGSTSLKVTEGSIVSPTLTVTVAPGTAIKFAFSASTTSLVGGGSANLTTTAQDSYGNTVTTYTGSHNLTYSGASSSPNGTAPTVANSSGTATNFGTATAITFTSGVASVSSSKNGLLKLYRAESVSVSVSDGTISSVAPIVFTVTPTTATRWALTNINISAGSLGSTCLFTCTVTSLGNSGTVKAKVTVTDAYGNTVSALGTGHSAKVTVTTGSGTVSGSPLAIPGTGAAETATSFTFTSKSSGTFTETITAAAQEGTAYTPATLTASK